MNDKTLKDLFLAELADMYDAEGRIIKALPRMAKAATCTDLKASLERHLEKSHGHVTKLERVFQSFDMKAKGKTCEATRGLLEEADEIASDFKGSPAINAAIISAVQKVEHYEMASYGCLHEWAGLLENKKAANLLEEILDEEQACNEELTTLALAKSNEEALCRSCSPEKEQGRLPRTPARPHKKVTPVRRGTRPLGLGTR